MSSGLRSWCAAISLAAGLSFAAQAAYAIVYEGITMDQLKSILTAEGVTFSEARPGFLKLDGGPTLQLTQCKDTTCYEIQIEHAYNNVRPTLEAVNEWNYNGRIAKASIDSEGFLHLDAWISTVGMTEMILLDSIGWLEVEIEQGLEFWRPYMLGPDV